MKGPFAIQIRTIRWLLVGVLLVAALTAASLIVFAHVQPPVDPLTLLRFNAPAMTVIMTAGALTLIVGFIGSWLFRHAGRVPRSRPWYLRVLQILIVVAWLEGLTAGYATVLLRDGKWFVGGRSTPSEVSEAVAMQWLWRDFRAQAALALCLSCMWVLLLLPRRDADSDVRWLHALRRARRPSGDA